jgi:hypothetical protein
MVLVNKKEAERMNQKIKTIPFDSSSLKGPGTRNPIKSRIFLPSPFSKKTLLAVYLKFMGQRLPLFCIVQLQRLGTRVASPSFSEAKSASGKEASSAGRP